MVDEPRLCLDGVVVCLVFWFGVPGPKTVHSEAGKDCPFRSRQRSLVQGSDSRRRRRVFILRINYFCACVLRAPKGESESDRTNANLHVPIPHDRRSQAS